MTHQEVDGDQDDFERKEGETHRVNSRITHTVQSMEMAKAVERGACAIHS